MNQTIPHELNPLPEATEQQLADLEARHELHQKKMEEQRMRKVRAREEHRARRFRRKPIPINMV